MWVEEVVWKEEQQEITRQSDIASVTQVTDVTDESARAAS